MTIVVPLYDMIQQHVKIKGKCYDNDFFSIFIPVRCTVAYRFTIKFVTPHNSKKDFYDERQLCSQGNDLKLSVRLCTK